MALNKFGRRIEYYRSRAGLTQKELAAALSVAKSSISQYESGDRTPSDEVKLKLCHFFGISPNELMGFTPKSRMGDAYPCTEAANVSVASLGDDFPVRVMDDAMAPAIHKGDVVMVHKERSIGNMELAVVQLDDGPELLVRRVQFTDGGVRLSCENPRAESPVFFRIVDKQNDSIKILGRVTEVRRKL